MSNANNAIPRSLAEKFKNPAWGAKKLKEISIFKHFTEKGLIELYQSGEIKAFNAHANVIIEGEASRGVYIILHGALSVHKNDLSTGAMFRIAYLEEGTTLGEMSLFDSAPRSATVTAETTCYLFYLDISVFNAYLERRGDNLKSRFYQACAEDLSDRFRAINNDYITSQQLLWKYALRRNSTNESEANTTEKQATS